MGLVVAILLTLAVLGSVLWVMPSPREKRLIEMRQRALTAGLKVRLLDQNLAAKLFPWLEDHRVFALYEKYVQLSEKNRPFDTRVIRLSPGYVPHELDQGDAFELAIREAVESKNLPESVEAIVFFSGSVSLLWTEKEGIEGVDQVQSFLEESVGIYKSLKG